MNAVFLNQYRTQKGTVMFRYIVKGTKDELAAYQQAQGENYRPHTDGQPLFFSQRFIGNRITLGISSKGKLFMDTSTLDKARSLVETAGGLLGDKLATAFANHMMRDIMEGPSSSKASISQPDESEPTQVETKEGETPALDA